MSTNRATTTAVQEGLDALFVAAMIALVLALVVPSLRDNALLVGTPLLVGLAVAVLVALLR